VETLASREPRAMREVLELAGTRQLTTLLGNEGWIEDANGQVRAATGDELVSLVFAHHLFFHRYLEGASREFDLERRGTERTFVFRPHPQGLERTLVIGDDSLPWELRQWNHGVEVVTTFGDWRSIEGVLFPHRAVQRTGDPRFDITITTTKIELFPALAEGAISRPAPRIAEDFRFVDTERAANIPFEALGNLVLVKLEVNGVHDAVFLLDTGAGATVVSEALVRRAGLPTRGRLEGRGAGGSAPAAYVEIERLALPGVELEHQTLVALSLETISEMLDRPIEGILGYDFLSRFAVEIDYPQDLLGIHPAGAYVPPEAAVRLPLRVESNVPRVEAVLEEETRGSFLFDTGNNHGLLLHAPFVRERGLHERDGQPSSLAGIAGTESVSAIPIRSLKLGSLEYHDLTALVSTAEQGVSAIGEAIGNIGGALFQDETIAIDYSEGALWIVPATSPSASPR
jgi:hypothetical protein